MAAMRTYVERCSACGGCGCRACEFGGVIAVDEAVEGFVVCDACVGACGDYDGESWTSCGACGGEGMIEEDAGASAPVVPVYRCTVCEDQRWVMKPGVFFPERMVKGFCPACVPHLTVEQIGARMRAEQPQRAA